MQISSSNGRVTLTSIIIIILLQAVELPDNYDTYLCALHVVTAEFDEHQED